MLLNWKTFRTYHRHDPEFLFEDLVVGDAVFVENTLSWKRKMCAVERKTKYCLVVSGVRWRISDGLLYGSYAHHNTHYRLRRLPCSV